MLIWLTFAFFEGMFTERLQSSTWLLLAETRVRALCKSISPWTCYVRMWACACCTFVPVKAASLLAWVSFIPPDAGFAAANGLCHLRFFYVCYFRKQDWVGYLPFVPHAVEISPEFFIVCPPRTRHTFPLFCYCKWLVVFLVVDTFSNRWPRTPYRLFAIVRRSGVSFS